jgi:hypothetical protein
MTKLGLILGLIIFLICSATVLYTTKILLKTAYRHDILNYSKLINIFYGNRGVLIYEIMNLLANMGTIIVYQQISI